MKRTLIRGGFFAVVLIVLLYNVSKPFRLEDLRVPDTYEELYTSDPDDCDAILVGGSNCYAYFQSPFAWHDSGITMLNMGIPAVRTGLIRYIIEEARKTQPDALYVITVNSLKEGVNDSQIHYATDYMKFGLTKVNAINANCDLGGIGVERLKFFFPILQFHGNWDSIKSESYIPQYKNVKAGAYYNTYMYGINDVSDKYVTTNDRKELSQGYIDTLEVLFDYLESSGTKVLFVRLPQAMETKTPLCPTQYGMRHNPGARL